MAGDVVRYNTDIPTEFTYKYRERKPTVEGDFYYGKDSDMLYKTWVAMKRGAIVGVSVGAVMSTYQPKQAFAFGPAVEQFYRHGVPPVIAATTFGATLSLAANLRGKEDALNHAIGGYAAGTILGAWYKTPKIGFWTGIFLAILASSLKVGSQAGVFETPMLNRKERVFDFYRTGWMIERPHQEGVDYQGQNDTR